MESIIPARDFLEEVKGGLDTWFGVLGLWG